MVPISSSAIIVHILSLCSVANGYVNIALLTSHVQRSTSTQLRYDRHPHWPDWPPPEDHHSSNHNNNNFFHNNEPIFYNDFEQDNGGDDAFQMINNFAEYQDTSSSSSSLIPPNLRITTNPDTNISDYLNTRISQVTQKSRRLLKNWRKGKAESFGAFTINEEHYCNNNYHHHHQDTAADASAPSSDDTNTPPLDLVRRVDIGQYPRVACGSAHGSIFVADTTSKHVLGVARGVHYSEYNADTSGTTYVNALDEQLRQYIYGEYDGGGTLDVAMFGKNIVASSGREGGVKLFKLIETGQNEAELTHQGDIPALIRPMPGALPIVVTCMKFDSVGRLYLGCGDGFLRIVTFPQDFIFGDNIDLNSQELDVTVVPYWSDDSPSPILSLDVSEESDMVVTAHVNGNVCLFSMKEQEDVYNIASGKQEVVGVIGVWNPFTVNKTYARSVTLTSKDTMLGSRYAVVVGGGNGEVWVNDIYPESIEGGNMGEVFVDNYVQKFEPNHVGPVVSLASRPEGLIVSVGHDGMLRMTQTWIGQENPVSGTPWPLYGLGGYKVWIGSVCVDDEGKRLVSDGMDDAVIVHDFSSYKDEKD